MTAKVLLVVLLQRWLAQHGCGGRACPLCAETRAALAAIPWAASVAVRSEANTPRSEAGPERRG